MAEQDDLPALNPSNIDIDAGSWKACFIISPDSFAVGCTCCNKSSGLYR
jgi:hypothetical protein